MTPKEAIYLADYCLDNTQVREALKDMARQVEELQDDAERYRWLRDSPNSGKFLGSALVYFDEGSPEFDKSIDAARKAK